MAKYIEGVISGKGRKFAVVLSRTNEFVTKRLLDGALDAFRQHEVADGDVTVVYCPGSFELPAVAKRMANRSGFDGVVCLGAVIRGDTPHFQYIASEVAKGVAAVSMEAAVPVVFGVLTTDTLEQAVERAGSKAGNKGREAALVALEMADLYGKLDGKGK
ncbi:MAG: 6,7-dimethyl-8-ribityllumazine synthase [Candidatus Zixiibacteriota bacterium]|jgi:6,7-dimethyl-8-ribityllumazine synthase